MLVTKRNFNEFLKEIENEKQLGFDTETTTLSWHESPWHNFKPRVFAMQFATPKKAYYLDFEHDDDKCDVEEMAALSKYVFDDPSKTWFIANAKFDLHHMLNHGVRILGTVHCTRAIARVMNNCEESLKLDDLSAKYLGAKKLDMHSYVLENNLFTKVKKFGNNDKYVDFFHYDLVSLKMMYDYGIRDAQLVLKLGQYQLDEIKRQDRDISARYAQDRFPGRLLSNVMRNEYVLTKVFLNMEREGVQLDISYTEQAYENEIKEYTRIESELDAVAAKFSPEKMDWLAPKKLKVLFDALGLEYGYTAKGSACFDKEALENMESDFARAILKYRYHHKRAHTYFENYLWMCDKRYVLHADAQQAGTTSGRTSYWTPNLQNVPKRGDSDETDFKVRRCFIPKPGGFFAEYDFDGAEYYMTLDYAGELPMIELIKSGVDAHKHLGGLMNLERGPAKTMQFRILYGAGQTAIGRALGYKNEQTANAVGNEKKKEYFERLPKVAEFLNGVTSAARGRGFIANWFGRILQFGAQDSYKGPNVLIQSGVGDMTKVAQVKLACDVLPSTGIKMLLQVHDSILMWIPYGSEHMLQKIKECMESVYPHKDLAMSASAAYSKVSWSDLNEEIPTA